MIFLPFFHLLVLLNLSTLYFNHFSGFSNDGPLSDNQRSTELSAL